MSAEVADWPVGSAAVGVLQFPGRSTAPGGPARLVANTGPIGVAFPWASVTKPASALAVLVAVEEGSLSLDEPAGPPGSTVAHLLAHASGLGPDDEDPPVAPAGARRIYSNVGYRMLAHTLADRTGMPFSEYLAHGVLDPLGMDSSWLDPEASGGPAAAGLVGPLVDLVALAAEWAVPTLVSPETHRSAVSVRVAGLAGVLPGFGLYRPCDWGLGVEIKGTKQPHWTGASTSSGTFGHFGQSGSFLWVDPEAGVACAGLADRPFGPWAAAAWPALADAILASSSGRGHNG